MRMLVFVEVKERRSCVAVTVTQFGNYGAAPHKKAIGFGCLEMRVSLALGDGQLLVKVYEL